MEEQKRKDAKQLIEHVPAAMSVDINAFFEEWAEIFSCKIHCVHSLHGIEQLCDQEAGSKDRILQTHVFYEQ